MKKFMKAIALCLSLVLCLSFPLGASAACVDDATIDLSAKGSLTIYKADLTNAEKDGVWDSSYVSTGVADQNVYDALIGANRAGDSNSQSDLGNGNQSFGYAIRGVEFTYLRIADVIQFSESASDQDHVEVLYGIDKTKGADFLKALSLENGAQRYENADHLDAGKYFYQSDVLIRALANGLDANATTVKNALEKYVAANGGTAMPLTDEYGKTQAENLELGLYLVMETKVPEMVVSTTNPFLVSLPMTSVNGTNATDGGTRWIYDVTLYPKNLTGIPTLEKTLRENKDDTGKHNGSGSITDGYAHTGTASDGDVIDYQLVSTLPSITSESTYLTCYTFVDTLSKGISYNKNDVTLEFFTDAACTDRITTWKETDGKFTVSYNTTDANESVMTVEMTPRGLAEINTSKTVYTQASMVNSGYSDCTVRITYKATVHSDSSVNYGDAGNPNDVVLTWKRSSQDYYDTLVDDSHIYNNALYESDQAGLSDPSAYEAPSFILADYGLPDEVFGVVSIPKLEVELPLYLGATRQHMAEGAAHMTQTSLPIGGDNTNCVIAGHRGWKGAEFFLYLPQLEQGDIVQVTNLWETLTYKVVETKIINPDEVEAIHIQPGKALLTLLTCHPPASGGKQRYLVFCERVQTEMEVS